MIQHLYDEGQNVSLRVCVPLGDDQGTKSGRLDVSITLSAGTIPLILEGPTPNHSQWLGNQGLSSRCDTDILVQFTRSGERTDLGPQYERFIDRCHMISLKRNDSTGMIDSIEYQFAPAPVPRKRLFW